MASITGEELSKHNSKDSCWVAINNTVWDVTSFVPRHPGGASLILKLAGQDATEQYDTFHDAALVQETLGSEAKLGTIDTSSLPKPASKPKEVPLGPQDSTPRRPPLSSIINLHDFQKVAERFMTPLAWAYISSGSDNEISLNENAAAYSRVFLRGRILRKIANVDTSTTILGFPSSLPIYTSPVGLGKLVHPDGECAIAQADGKEGICQVVNTVSSMPIEAIMDARVKGDDQPVFWQLYLDKDLEKSKAFVQRVERCGVKAIWLTVDSPVTGNRERDERRKDVDDTGEEIMEDVVSNMKSGGAGIAASNNSFINGDVDWSIIEWLRSITTLPIVVKGIGCVEDAVAAYTHGADAIVLSNHGGRSQDTSQPPLLTLLEIRTYAPHIMRNRMQIFVDGGVRRGTDVLKALCLGADAVGIGRPVLFSMAAGYGHYGIRRMIQILRKEIETNMAFLGARTVKELSPHMVNAKPLENMMISLPNL
ncbi:putative FMN-dependent dehydrogenase, cytochrome b5-like heme/steroid binding protein [Septoria linicola]|nr:putative FMN-dependent dehydrogenase, cytochrome b5-like heme/steroid binding protein [Septoria linicola]